MEKNNMNNPPHPYEKSNDISNQNQDFDQNQNLDGSHNPYDEFMDEEMLGFADFLEASENQESQKNLEGIDDDFQEMARQQNRLTIEIANNLLTQRDQLYALEEKIDTYQEPNQTQLNYICQEMALLRTHLEHHADFFSLLIEEQKSTQAALQKQQEHQENQILKTQKEHMVIHDAYQKPLKKFIIELQNIYKESKMVYYKPFFLHGLFFIVMAAALSIFLNIYISEIKRQRELNQQELILIQQSKKGNFTQCGDQGKLCVKIDKQKFYGKDGEYAIVVP